MNRLIRVLKDERIHRYLTEYELECTSRLVKEFSGYVDSLTEHVQVVNTALKEEGVDARHFTLSAISYIYPFSVGDLLCSPEWDMYIHDRLGNDLFISDPERAERIYEAAKYGGDGSTHAEVIDDWRNFIDNQDYPHYIIDFITKDIDEIEEWHEKNGSINDVIG